jgi:tRNA-splicing ligase RtcB (3'-phosphate/5'-hydroxy nucleic acid ligase)
MIEVTPELRSWASDIEPETLEQALKASRLPILAGPVALMPDAHLGIGATVGSVIATDGAVIPAAVGVDLGCGMIAVETDLSVAQLPDDLHPYLARLEVVLPAGLGKWHADVSDDARAWLAAHPNPSLTPKQEQKAMVQFGTLGSGNHFFEVCADEREVVWITLHSGSRGVGNQLAMTHIKVAKAMAAEAGVPLEDPDLASLQERTPQFDAYVRDMLWSQVYAAGNRGRMMDAALATFFAFVGTGAERLRVNCHHNFAQRERHGGRDVWVTRKGAIKAGRDDLGLIPGSMGTRSYVIRGRGNPLSYESCAHGAGRRMSRTQARKRFGAADLADAMRGRTWLSARAEQLVDEIPAAYKDVDQVMADQADLAEVLHTLRGLVNYKGV